MNHDEAGDAGEAQVGDLLHRVGAAVPPDVATLVAGGVARGRRRRRRRRTAAALATAAACAAVLVPGVLALRGDGSAPTEVDAADRGPRVAVPADEMTPVLVRLLPTSTPATDQEPFQYGVQRGVVRWRGVRVSVSLDDRYVGSPGTARERCETYRSAPCTRAGDAGWLTASGSYGAPTATGEEPYSDVVRLYEPGGWVVEATGERGDARDVDEGRGSAADRTVLRRLVLDDAWFR